MELLFHTAAFEVTADAWFAITGAAHANVDTWRVVRLSAGTLIELQPTSSGVWSYLAIEGGFAAPRYFGSASVYERGRIGSALRDGEILLRSAGWSFRLPAHVAGQSVEWSERRDYRTPPGLRFWRGPQWDRFSGAAQSAFQNQEWSVSSRSDRVGYRLNGTPLEGAAGQIISEPVRAGSIQVPESGEPIVTMPDGPTVGGYMKLGVVHPDDLSWLAQCRPGQRVDFRLLDET